MKRIECSEKCLCDRLTWRQNAWNREEREKKTNGLRKKKIISSHKCEATFDGATTSDLPSISLRGNSRSTVVVHAPHDLEFAGLNPTRFN